MDRRIAGPFAGFVATLPMTAAMELLHRELPIHRRQALPPRRVAMNVLGKLGVRQHLDEPERAVLTVASHFAYGAAAGALYPPIAGRLPGGSIAKGIGFGLAVWAGSYLGMLPAAGLFNPPSRQSARRNALMIASHVVWGATLGLVADRLGADRPSGGDRS